MFTARWSSRFWRKGRGPLKFDPRDTVMGFYLGYAIGDVAAEDGGGSSTASLEVGLQLVGPFAIWTGSSGSITFNYCASDCPPTSRFDDGFGVRRAFSAESWMPASSQPLAPMRRASRQRLDGAGPRKEPGRIRAVWWFGADEGARFPSAGAGPGVWRGRRICRPRSDRLLIRKPAGQDTAQELPPN